MNEAEQFFYDNAGFSYLPRVEQPEQGRRRCAQELARAEAWAERQEAVFEWSDDFGIDHVAEFPDAYDSEPETCEIAIMRIDSETVAVLGCIDDATDDYRRVIEAELASEAFAEMSEAFGVLTNRKAI